MFRLIPRALHRALLAPAFRVRHHWRVWRKTPIAGCSVIVADLAGHILLVRHSYGPDAWALPGGGLGRREQPEDAARREVREETGLELGKLTPVGRIEEEISGSRHTAHVFFAITDGVPSPDRREVMEARFFPTHSLPEPLGGATRRRLDLWRAR